MSKVGILGDIHGGHHTTKKHPYIIKGILRYVKELMIQHKIDHLIQMGDLFDVRTSIDVEVYNQILDIIKEELDDNPFYVDVIAGNHDLAKKNTRNLSSLRMLDHKELNNIRFLTQPEVRGLFGSKYKVLFEPWLTNAEDKELFEMNLKQVDYVFGHFELPFVSHGEASDIITVDIDDFYGKKRVFSGHYHNPGVHGDNFLYVGSCVHLTWNDHNDTKYFYIYDFDKNELQRFPLNHLFPNFIRLAYNNLDKSLFDLLPGAHIEMTLNPESFDKYEEIHEYFKNKFKPLSLNFSYDNKESLLKVQDQVSDVKFVVENLAKVVVDIYTEEYGKSKSEVDTFAEYVSQVEKVNIDARADQTS